MTETLKAADLSRKHLGMNIRVTQGAVTISDQLSGVSHVADLIDDRKLFEEVPTFALGRIATSLTFANAGQIQVAGEADVSITS